MSEQEITALLRRAPFSFIGTVEHLGAATMGTVPVDERTAVVHVDHVLHAPEAFGTLEGQRVTLQLAPDADPLEPGGQLAFFAEGQAFGESIALSEVGRLPIEAVEPQMMHSFDAGHSTAFADLERQIEADRVREHADTADALVVGRVVGLEKARQTVMSEHDPDWWVATLQVFHVEKGDAQEGELEILYANSLDVRWRTAPKPKASQGGLWVLHATEGELRELAPFQILHPEDFQPLQELDAIRDDGG